MGASAYPPGARGDLGLSPFGGGAVHFCRLEAEKRLRPGGPKAKLSMARDLRQVPLDVRSDPNLS